MTKSFALNLPLGGVSFGVVSTALCREIYRRGISPCIFPIGQPDLSAQEIDNEFGMWLQSNINKSFKMHDRKNVVAKLWHCSGLMESYSEEQIAIPFLETDTITDFELNVLKNQKLVFVTSNFTKQVMEDYGLKNVKYLELGFDKDNFKKLDKKYLNDRITWNLAGKLEPNRKAHIKILANWAKKYGNQREHFLSAAIFNVFLKPEDQEKMIAQAFNGQRYWNIQFLGYMKTNKEYNDYINSGDIYIALSRGEGRDLPAFHSVALGKHCLGLNAHAYKDYLNEENAVLINPTSKIKAADGMFFQEQGQWSQGNFFDWSDDDFMSACDVVVQRFKSNPINTKGLELQNRTYSQTLDTILGSI